LSFGKQPHNIVRSGQVRLDRDGLSTACSDVAHDLIAPDLLDA